MSLTDPFTARRDPEQPDVVQVLAGGDRTGGSAMFANLGDVPARALATALPAGLEGMFAEQASYITSLEGPPDPERIREIAAAYGVRSLGPPMDVG